MRTLSMIRGSSLTYEEANWAKGGKQATEEEAYDGGTLDTVVVTGEKTRVMRVE